MFDVGFDVHFAHVGSKPEVEVETVVRSDGGGIRSLPFLEEGEFQDQFLDVRIEVAVLDGTRDDDFAFRCQGRRLLVSLASAEQQDGQE
jgi:hypothetical protein